MAEEFDPSKPFKVIKGGEVEFDPNKPFDVVSGPKAANFDFKLDQPYEVKKNDPPGIFESILRGAAQGATLGFADEGAALAQSVFGDKTYQQYRDEQRVADDNARLTNPKAFVGSEFAAGTALPIGAIGALKKLGYLKGAATAAAEAEQAAKTLNLLKRAGAGAGQVALTDYGQQKGNFNPKETATAAASGAVLSFAPEAIKGIAHILAMGLAKPASRVIEFTGQLPQRVLEWGAEKIGKNTPSELIEKTSYRETGSKKTKEFGEALRRRALTDKDDIIKKMSFNPTHMSYEDLTPAQRDELAGVLQNLLRNRGRDAYEVPKDIILRQLESQLSVSGNLGKTPVIDLIQARVRMTPKTAFEYAATANRAVPTDNINSEAALTARASIINTLEEYGRGLINQNFEDVAKYGEGMKKAGFGNIIMDLENKYHAPPSPRERVVLREIEESANKARESLKNINIGRERIKNGIGAIAGIGPGTVGIVDTLGSVAQFSGRMGSKITPENVSKSVVANPSILYALSKSNSALGRIAGEMFDSINESGATGLKSKSFVMAMHPQFRSLFSDDKASQDLQNQEPIQH